MTFAVNDFDDSKERFLNCLLDLSKDINFGKNNYKEILRDVVKIIVIGRTILYYMIESYRLEYNKNLNLDV